MASPITQQVASTGPFRTAAGLIVNSGHRFLSPAHHLAGSGPSVPATKLLVAQRCAAINPNPNRSPPYAFPAPPPSPGRRHGTTVVTSLVDAQCCQRQPPASAWENTAIACRTAYSVPGQITTDSLRNDFFARRTGDSKIWTPESCEGTNLALSRPSNPEGVQPRSGTIVRWMCTQQGRHVLFCSHY